MALIEIPLLQHKAHFRPLTWREELRVHYNPKLDPRKVPLETLCAALVDMSGLAITTAEDARKVMTALPHTILRRVWVLYKAGLPKDRFFTTRGLYTAPERDKHNRRLEAEEAERDQITDQATAGLEARFGKEALGDARRMQDILIKKAKQKGLLTPATEEGL
jgi:hypothetical protein